MPDATRHIGDQPRRTPPPLRPGDVVDQRYTIGALIARGGMSSVYTALDTRLGRRVALKVMDPALASQEEFRRRFTREARAVARLNHETLVNVHDQGVDRRSSPLGTTELVFLVMELVSGGTLRELLAERGHMPPHAAFAVMRPVLTALSIAHDNSMIHRDIKPDNILISDTHQVKLADFGLVRAITHSRSGSDAALAPTHPGTTQHTAVRGNQVIGTASYLAPEQVRGEELTFATDVYSVGIVLFEVLTGTKPFDGPDPVSIARARLSADVPAPSTITGGIDPAIDEIVAKACHRDPTQRYASAAEFLEDIEAVAEELGMPFFRLPAPRNSAVHRALNQDDLENHPDSTTEDMYTGYLPIVPDEAASPLPPRSMPSAEPSQTHHLGGPLGVYPPGAVPQGAVPPSPLPPNAVPPNAVPPTQGPPMQGRSPQYAPLPQESGYDPYAGAIPASASGPAPGQHGGRAPAPTAPRYALNAVRATGSPRMRVLGFLLILVMLAGVALGGWWVTTGRYGDIPQVLGLDERTALAVVEEAGFASHTEQVYHDTVPAQAVVGTMPPFGERGVRGSDVAVLVSLGVPTVPHPAKEDTVNQYRDKLRTRTLSTRVGEEEYSDSIPRGGIASVDPSPGTEVRTGSEVTVHLSKGPAPVRLPDVAGMELGRARSILEDAGLRVKVRKEFDADIAEDAVIRMSPDTGEVPRGTEVELTVSNAKEVPRVTDRDVAEATRALRSAGFQVEVGSPTVEGTTEKGKVAAQQPAAGTRLRPGDTVRITPSNGVTVPSVVLRPTSTARSRMADAGLKVRVIGEGAIVTGQEPPANTRVKEGTTVTLTTKL